MSGRKRRGEREMNIKRKERKCVWKRERGTWYWNKCQMIPLPLSHCSSFQVLEDAREVTYLVSKWYIDQEKENKLMRIEIWWRKRAMWSYKTSITLPTKHQRGWSNLERKWVQGTLQLDLFFSFLLVPEKYYPHNKTKKEYDEKRKLKKGKRDGIMFSFEKCK